LSASRTQRAAQPPAIAALAALAARSKSPTARQAESASALCAIRCQLAGISASAADSADGIEAAGGRHRIVTLPLRPSPLLHAALPATVIVVAVGTPS